MSDKIENKKINTEVKKQLIELMYFSYKSGSKNTFLMLEKAIEKIKTDIFNDEESNYIKEEIKKTIDKL